MGILRPNAKGNISRVGRAFTPAVAGGAAEVAVNATDFDGTNDVITRGALTGVSNTSKFIFSCWVRLDGGNATQMDLADSDADAAWFITRTGGDKFRFSFQDPTRMFLRIEATGKTTLTSSATWHHLLVSWDLTSAETFHFYLDDADEKNGSETVSVGTVLYEGTGTPAYGIGGGSNPTSESFNGCISEFYFNTDEFLDFSDEDNRRKFRSSGGKPVELGSDGSDPTGNSPLIYLPNAFGSFETNAGTGGNFTVTGALADCSDSPSD